MNVIQSNVSPVKSNTGISGVNSFGGVRLSTNNKTFESYDKKKLNNSSSFGSPGSTINRGGLSVY